MSKTQTATTTLLKQAEATPASNDPALPPHDLSSASDATDPSSPSHSNEPAAVSLPELDNDLAADFDQMLQGNFESIDAVLDGVFEEQAVLVQNPGQPAIPVLRKTQQPAPDAIEEPPPMIETVEPPIASMAAEETIQPDERVATPAPVAASSEPQVQPAARVETLPVQQAPRTQAPPVKPPVSGKPKPSSVVRFLMAMNYPMRLLPAGAKVFVNWAAFSLIAWVPIVWLLIMMGGGTRQPVAPQSTLASTETAQASNPDDSIHPQ